jgi:hypothetical protein
VKKDLRNIVFSFFFFTGIFLISECSLNQLNPESTGVGILSGTINIGPLCPVETVPPDPGCLPTPATYRAYPVGIWTVDGKQLQATISPNVDGSFNLQLPQGRYMIERINAQSGVGGSNLPVIVSILTDNTTVLYITIDTGIR